MKVILKLYWDFPMKVVELPEKTKMYDGRRLSSLSVYEYNEENLKLMVEHNKLIEEYTQLGRKITKMEFNNRINY
jgi:hypothetical protein